VRKDRTKIGGKGEKNKAGEKRSSLWAGTKGSLPAVKKRSKEKKLPGSVEETKKTFIQKIGPGGAPGVTEGAGREF